MEKDPNFALAYAGLAEAYNASSVKFDPESTVPMPAGSFVTHFAKGVHYDGSKDGEAIIEIVGDVQRQRLQRK